MQLPVVELETGTVQLNTYNIQSPTVS